MKEKIREELIKKRKNLSKNEVLEKSKLILNQLIKMDEFKQASTILFYISYDNEVFTHDKIREHIPVKNIIVPVTDVKNKKLILSKLENWDNLKVGAYRILEPLKEKMINVSIDNIDMVIVPGVGFNEHGNRVGHGKGYYDKLLKEIKNALFVGLAFEFQIVRNIPSDINDIPVNLIITEDRIIKC
jgi:5-formyltetrahydrofolate cyclo-ligase